MKSNLFRKAAGRNRWLTIRALSHNLSIVRATAAWQTHLLSVALTAR